MEFFNRFTCRGHKHDALIPLFLKAIQNARIFIAKSDGQRASEKERKHEEASRRLYLHLKFHPQNPTSNQIQQLFHETALHPPVKKHLNEIDAGYGFTVSIDAMIIAYHQAPNLGDKFSYRNISKRNAPPPLSLHIYENRGPFFQMLGHQLRWHLPAFEKKILKTDICFCYTVCRQFR
ncbi:hypothetical protein ACHAXR_000417 [Thalassiosira sp. AJA248-18]